MKQIPYNSYINFSGLASLYKTASQPQDILLTSASLSLQLSSRLLGSTLKESHPSPEKVSDILSGIHTQFRILETMITSRSDNPPSQIFHSGYFEAFLQLNSSSSDTLDGITRAYFSVMKKYGACLGAEKQMNRIRTQGGLPEIVVNFSTNSSDNAATCPMDIGHLTKASYYNSEDELFMTVHQISECWFRIGLEELSSIERLFGEGTTDWATYQPHFAATIRILQFLSEHILLLEHMVLADYHPLRVALRGASGGQSQQAYALVHLAKKAFSAFLTLLSEHQVSVLTVLEAPRRYGDFVTMVNHFSRLERTLKNFFFQHYALSSSVIGSESFGSIGHELVSLSDKFVQPMFQEIDQAKYDFTLKTNFQYGATAGVIILETEEAPPTVPASEPTEVNLIDCAIKGYFDAISELNSEKWIGLFAETGYIEDPVGSRPYIGHRELFIFFKGVKRTFSALTMTILNQQRDQNRVEVEWHAEASSYHGKHLSFTGTEVFTICPQGKILSAQVYWDPSVVAAQL